MEKSAVGNRAARRIIDIFGNKLMKTWDSNNAEFKNAIHLIHNRIRNRNIFEKLYDSLSARTKDVRSLRAGAAERLGIMDRVNDIQRQQRGILNASEDLIPAATRTASQNAGGSFKFLGMPAKAIKTNAEPWWGISELVEQELPAATKEWSNIPKYLRNAYEAGHTVTPPSGYNMRKIAPGISKSVL